MKKMIMLLFTVIIMVFLGVFMAYGSILNYNGQADVFIRPADRISPYSFPVYVNGKEIELTYWEEKDNFQYTFNYNAKSGDIEITPKTGYKITSVVLNEGFVEVWNSDTPATKEQIDNQTYDATTYYDLTAPDIADNFYEKYSDGTVNYNGKFTLSRDFLTKSPYVGWKKGEAMIFAVGKSPGPGGTVTMTVTTDFIPSEGVKIIAENEPEFIAYSFNGRIYIGHQQLEDAINEAIKRHSITPGYTVTIGQSLLRGVKGYVWPPNPHEHADVTFGNGKVVFTLVPDCKMVITLIYDGASKGEIAYSRVLPLNPDIPPDTGGGGIEQIENQTFFDAFVNSCRVDVKTPDTGASPQTFYDYNTCNNYLMTIPSNTDVSLTYDFKNNYYLKSASSGTVTNDGKTLNIKLLGPTAIMTGENGALEPRGEWTGTIVGSENGEPEYENGIPHYDIDTMGWKQDYTEGETLSVEMIMATSRPQLAIGNFTAEETFGSNNLGHVVTAYISNSSVLDEGALSGAKIKLSGTCKYTDNPNNEKNNTLPEVEYKLDSDIPGGTYCGYWFSPANGNEMQYRYTYEIKAVLVMPDGEEITETYTVDLDGSDIQKD